MELQSQLCGHAVSAGLRVLHSDAPCAWLDALLEILSNFLTKGPTILFFPGQEGTSNKAGVGSVYLTCPSVLQRTSSACLQILQ